MNTVPNCFGVIDYGVKLSTDIIENYHIFKEIFKDDNTVIIRMFENKKHPDIKYLGISTSTGTSGIPQHIFIPP